jgi:hypothetical protein
MRALSAFGVFAEPAPGIFAPTPVSDRLRDGAPDSIFVAAYNFARRLKTLRGLTPYEAICRAWTDEPSRFIHDPHHQISGPNI